MKGLSVQSSPIRRQLGEKWVCEKIWLLTFFEQSVKLAEERRDFVASEVAARVVSFNEKGKENTQDQLKGVVWRS